MEHCALYTVRAVHATLMDGTTSEKPVDSLVTFLVRAVEIKVKERISTHLYNIEQECMLLIQGYHREFNPSFSHFLVRIKPRQKPEIGVEVTLLRKMPKNLHEDSTVLMVFRVVETVTAAGKCRDVAPMLSEDCVLMSKEYSLDHVNRAQLMKRLIDQVGKNNFKGLAKPSPLPKGSTERDEGIKHVAHQVADTVNQLKATLAELQSERSSGGDASTNVIIGDEDGDKV